MLPELSVTHALATRLQDWTRRPDGPRLLVAGSFHHENVGAAVGDTASLQPRRRNTAIAYLRGSQPPLTQDKYSPADRPVHEDIRPSGWPELHIYVSGDGWHLAIAICRDLLNPHAVHAMSEAGVNLALVPAMSETLIAFGAPVAQLVGAGQAFVAVANNPADFSDTAALVARRPARALFGHPGFGQQTRLVHPPDGEPGMALLSVGTGQLQWLGADVVATIPPADAEPEPPPWAATLRRQCGPDRIGQDRPAGPTTLLPAAVLVLLTDTPHGPQALLTTRSPDLAHYPGQVVFPGGAADPGDDGPIGTALREAAEETGLDPSSVQILGTLPALALPDSGFLLTPVLAWSHRPVFTGSPNLSEVTAVTSIPVGPRTSPDTFARPPQEPDLATVAVAVSPLGAATATVIDTVTGMLTRGATPPAPSPGRALDRARSWPA